VVDADANASQTIHDTRADGAFGVLRPTLVVDPGSRTMTMLEEATEARWTTPAESPFAEHDLQSPFGETASEGPSSAPETVGFGPWAESPSPFAETYGAERLASESEHLLAEAFAELRDEAFDEAVAYLSEETEQAIADRFGDEAGYSGEERERFGDAHLSSARFEAMQYLERLEEGLSGTDFGSLSEQQLDEVLDRLDPEATGLTPAGEEFIGALVRKAKKAVKFVASAAKGVVATVGKVAGGLLGPVLSRLKALINPLLKRVLAIAIGRLPAPLQPAARMLAKRLTSEAESEAEGEAESEAEAEMLSEAGISPTNLTDVEALSESFDAALAEALVGEGVGESEGFDTFEENEEPARHLEALAEARGQLIDRLRSASDDEDLGPEIERFVPVLLGALRLGINLVGRPKVVNFLAGYLAKMIRGFVGPSLASPLSSAIVDTGLRLVALESESEMLSDEAAPIALAGLIEDTVREVAENEDYVLDNEDLLGLATSQAFGRSVGTNFPERYVRAGLRQAPTLGGTFVTRRPRSIRSYRKYSRTPEIELSGQLADTLPSFGGQMVGAALRAAGATFPMKARVHIYEARLGTTLPRMIRMDRSGSTGRGYVSSTALHPLTPAAAAALLREPGLGVAVAPGYLRSRGRIAVGQRFYLLEPLGAQPGLAALTTRAAAGRTAASHSWTLINLRRSRVIVGLYLSESDAQQIAAAMRAGQGGAALLAALVKGYRRADGSFAKPFGRVRVLREDHEDSEDLSANRIRLLAPAVLGAFRKRLRAWVLPALATWARTNGEAFARAAADPAPGVTVRLVLTAVPGLDLIARAITTGHPITPGAFASLAAKPSIEIGVTSGRRRRR
jgi:hypothetical protein